METIVIKKAKSKIELPTRFIGKDIKLNISETESQLNRESEIKEMANDEDFLNEISQISDDFKFVDSEGI